MVTLIASVVRSIDRSLFFSKLKLLILRVMTTVDGVSDKTKVADEFILRSVLLDCFTAELNE